MPVRGASLLAGVTVLSLLAVAPVALAPPTGALPVDAGGLVVRSAVVQVQSVTTPSVWSDATTVHEGSPARLSLDVDATPSGTARVVVTLPGTDRGVADASVAVPAGASTLAIPLDLSYGAWIPDGSGGTTPNPADRLDVSVSFTPTLPPSVGSTTAAPSASPTPAPTTSLSLTSSSSTSSAVPVATVPITRPSDRPLRVVLTGGASDARAVRTALRALPPGARVLVIIRPVAGKRADARRLARSVADLARVSGRTAVIRIGPSVTGSRMRLDLSAAPALSGRVGASSATLSIPLALAPRPVVLVHGMWSDATWWSSYTSSSGFLRSADPEWIGAAVNTMDTGSAFLPYRSVKSVAENAELTWTFIRSRMEALGAHEVDLVGHSLGGVIIRRMLHDPANGPAARSAVRSVVLLGTPNGGSDCSESWSVPANSEITFSAMSTFNLAYPGYPGAFTTSLYSDHIGFTCFGSSDGDLFVPAWSTQAQSVDAVTRINPGVQHAFLTSDSRVFSGYVRPALALAAPPSATGTTSALTNPNASTTRLADGTEPNTVSLSITRTITLEQGHTLVASVVAPSGATGTLHYPSGAGTASVALDAVGDYPLIEGEVGYAALGGTSGPVTVSVTISATTGTASDLRWSLVSRP